MTQGKPISKETIARIKHLLAKTDLAISEIAERMGCSKANIVAVNRKFMIRVYNQRRRHWYVEASKKSE
jgi:hypothetical protein